MTTASPFGAVEDSDDDEDWLADVDDSMSASVSVSTSDAQRVSWVDKEDARGFGKVEEEEPTTTTTTSSSVPTPGGPFGAVTPEPTSPSSWSPGLREAETGLRDAFGAASPSASESAQTPTAFGGHTEDGGGGFVEYAQGDLGALFGGTAGADEDWMSPTPVVSPPVAAPREVVADVHVVADKSPAAVTYATSGPFASPITTASTPPRDDGVAFFSSFNQGEPEEPVSDMFGSSEPVSIAPEPDRKSVV